MSSRDDSDSTTKKFFFNFNQNFSSLAVGTETGYKIFSLDSLEGLEKIHDSSDQPKTPESQKDYVDIFIIERLFSSSLVAVVSLRSPRKLKVYHFKKGSEICNYSYSNTILSVKLNRQRLVVCLEENLHIHHLKDMKCMHTIRDTPPNPRGLMALCPDDNCYLAYPGSSTIGEVQIFDALNLQNKTMIPAHNSPLAAMAFDQTGRMIATASEKGTVIRVFNVADGTKLYELRRGVIRNATIYSLSFSYDAKFLCASSNTETVHIFKLEQEKEELREDAPTQTWYEMMGKMFMSSTTFLPNQVSEILHQERSYAVAYLPFSGKQNVSSLAMVQDKARLMVASEDGYLYIYSVDLEQGGESSLEKSYKLDELELSETTHSQASERLTGYAAAVSRGLEVGSSTDATYTSVPEVSLGATPPLTPGYKLDDENDFPPMSHGLE